MSEKIPYLALFSGDDSDYKGKESENLEPELEELGNESSESESELGDQVEGGNDTDEEDESENDVDGGGEMRNNPPNAVSPTPNADAYFENSEGKRVEVVELITSNLRQKNLSDENVSLSLF